MRQRGVALITAVVLVAIATVLAARVGTEAALDLRRTAGIGALNQGWHVALGAEAWAAEILRKDLQDSQRDELDEPWAQPLPPLPVDGGTIEGGLEDMQGRFNLNNLLRADGTVDEANLERFSRLLRLAGVDQRFAGALADWLDADTVERFPDGAEDGVYLSQVPGYRAANGPVTSTSEMLALPGFTLDDFARLRPHVAALPAGTRINVCTATPLVLAALVEGGTDFGDAEALARNRAEGCFPLLTDLQATLDADQYQALAQVVAESSSWFRSVAVVSIGTSQLTLYSLLERNAAGGVRTVLRSSGTE
ncbi:MAG: type II secretion system minor pseudopilin GspK [Steroidobacteraceae bacterium]|jgi:general secretion pathway protein K|nr:type II secretion system minor pseudopilin GspK [Steroidobacteraceae bacterium]